MNTNMKPRAPARWKNTAKVVGEFVILVGGSMAVAAVFSQWESSSHGDSMDLASRRIILNLAIGGVAGVVLFCVRLVRLGD